MENFSCTLTTAPANLDDYDNETDITVTAQYDEGSEPSYVPFSFC